MVYGVLKLINFAHGDLFMWGAYLGLTGLNVAVAVLSGPSAWALVPVIIVVMLTVALAGVLVERVAYRPLRSAGRLAPVISALGLLATDVRHELVGACVGELGTMSVADIQRVLEGLVEEGNRRLASGGITDRDRVLDFSVDLLYGNQVYPLTVPLEDTDLLSDNWPSCLRSRFEAIYCARYGYDQPDQPVQARAIRLTAIGRLQRPQLATSTPGSARSTVPIGERPVYLGEWVPASVYVFEDLVPGERFSGPAVVDGNYTTVLLPPGCHAEVDPWGGLIIHVS
jgi:N-methylhydantoinase A